MPRSSCHRAAYYRLLDQVRETGDWGSGGSPMLRVHDSLKEGPLATVKAIIRRTGLTAPAAGSMLEELAAMRIAREITGGRRNRVFAYQRYLEILNEGTAEAAGQARCAPCLSLSLGEHPDNFESGR